ncbi:unnamed protein product [Vitrella brassicaformis CCMP3155]|uniref:TLDc domain-containing protein n=1 Tax=Vitrella brassicaformis (strain CCMP3155) TaxID=1169540 RepID=A0A0G4FRR0_VITBC|nr:unnamed protein product [Vitrella brassicaformis CCMP3155]|eukprot:CEM17338.1 unnamed protein product [Vitrella brassicaformis CCMP3155]
MQQMISEKGGTSEPQHTSGTLILNVGGTVFEVSRAALMRPSIVRKYLSVLLLRFDAALPRDAEKLPYLESCPAYFRWLLNELTFVERGRKETVELTGIKADDPSYAEYHALFTREVGSSSDDDSNGGGGGDVQMGEGEGQGQGDVADLFKAFDESRRAYERVYEALKAEKERMAAFLRAMEPFMKTDDSEEDEVLSVTIHGDRVSVMRRTLSPLGPNNTLYSRFSPTYWIDRSVRQTSAEHLQCIVDFARRQAVMAAGQRVGPPAVEDGERELFVEDLQMYGLKDQPFYRWGAGGGLIITSEDQLASVVEFTGRTGKTPSLLYKSSRDGFGYGSLLDCVGDASGLLFLVQHSDTHRFAAFVAGPLAQPADPTQEKATSCPVTYYSISGAYDAPTKLNMPVERRRGVIVAGRQGAVTSKDGEPVGKLAIDVRDTAVLWLGYADPGPAADLSSCAMCVSKDHLQVGYQGRVVAGGKGTLAGDFFFTASEIEVWGLAQ